MRVLQLGPYPPPEGGISRNILAIRAELVARDDESPIIVTSRSSRITPELEVFHPGSPFAFIRHLLSQKRDITHLHIGGDITTRLLGLAFVCALLAHGKSVLSFHSGGYPQTAKGKAASKWSIRGIIFRMFDRIIVVNPQLRQVFLKYGVGPENISVIYPFSNELPDETTDIPPDLALFVETHKPFLLTVGLLEPEYDLAMQIETLDAILKHFPEAGLMIVGSGSLESDLRKLIGSKVYSDKIFLVGDMPHPVTLHMIDRADILLRTTRFDGDAIAVREALFLGTPVIATDNGMRPESVRLIPLSDPKELEEAIAEIFTMPRSPQKAKQGDRSNISAVIELYRELLGKN